MDAVTLSPIGGAEGRAGLSVIGLHLLLLYQHPDALSHQTELLFCCQCQYWQWECPLHQLWWVQLVAHDGCRIHTYSLISQLHSRCGWASSVATNAAANSLPTSTHPSLSPCSTLACMTTRREAWCSVWIDMGADRVMRRSWWSNVQTREVGGRNLSSRSWRCAWLVIETRSSSTTHQVMGLACPVIWCKKAPSCRKSRRNCDTTSEQIATLRSVSRAIRFSPSGRVGSFRRYFATSVGTMHHRLQCPTVLSPTPQALHTQSLLGPVVCRWARSTRRIWSSGRGFRWLPSESACDWDQTMLADSGCKFATVLLSWLYKSTRAGESWWRLAGVKFCRRMHVSQMGTLWGRCQLLAYSSSKVGCDGCPEGSAKHHHPDWEPTEVLQSDKCRYTNFFWSARALRAIGSWCPLPILLFLPSGQHDAVLPGSFHPGCTSSVALIWQV